MYAGPFIIACKLSLYRLLSVQWEVKDLTTNIGEHQGKVPILCIPASKCQPIEKERINSCHQGTATQALSGEEKKV
jgi:hypothetical protein